MKFAISTVAHAARRLQRFLVICAVFLIPQMAIAQAPPVPLIYGYVLGGNRIVSFYATNPGTFISDVPIAGLASTDSLHGIDFRPNNGLLYAMVGPSTTGSIVQLATIDPTTGALTPVSASTFTRPSGIYTGFSFNPTVDRVRVITSTSNNYRVNPDTGSIAGADTALAYVSGDPHFGQAPNVVHVAYTNSVAGAPAGTSTVYGIDTLTDKLVRIGGPGGTPSPNTGQLTTIGPLGVDAGLSGAMDIQAGSEIAYAALQVGGVSRLYTIDLLTGNTTAIGQIGPVGSAIVIEGLAVSPVTPPNPCLDLDGDGKTQTLTDGLMLVRALLGMTGTAVTANALPSPAPSRPDWASIRAHMNANCGMNFAP
jgi:Domain of unknown function (DUF4394)